MNWPWRSAQIGLPAIVKTAAFGYDGKGQHRIDAIEEADRVWGYIGHQQAIVERVVDFTHEISVIGARGDGEFSHFGAIENIHKQHILDLSVCPARIAAAVANEAVQLTHRVMDELGYVGVLCVGFRHRKESSWSTRSRHGRTQLRPPHDRCAHLVAVRATRARGVRIVAR
jgi:5-(carboxyamino)imidazole ribonucleotide synthase